MFKKPVWDDLSFVTWWIILLDVHQKSVLCSHKGMDMVSSPKCAKKISPTSLHTPPAAWTAETRQDGSMLSCSLRQILTLHLNVAAEIKTHQTRQHFPIFYCSVLVILCELYPPCPVLIWQESCTYLTHPCGLLLLEHICFRVWRVVFQRWCSA